jgi:hypothetical protein
MNTRTLISLFVAAMLILASLACASTEQPGDPTTGVQPQPPSTGGDEGTIPGCEVFVDDFVNIAGTYDVEGGPGSPPTTTYTGELTITQLDRSCFSAAWSLSDGTTRTGTITMIGNVVGGTWQQGDQTGTLGGTAPDTGPLVIGIESDTGDDLVEEWTKQ